MVGSATAALDGLPAIQGRLAVAVPDLTRSVDTPAALRALAERLPGVEGKVVVGLGLHRRLTPEERAPLEAASPWPVLDHDPDACVSLGEVEGVPCLVNPALAEADSVLLVGKVELHQYAGFSGGHKASAVGCGGRATLAALHARAMVCHPDVVVGRLEGNPFRALVDALGERIGAIWALQQLPDKRWVGGPPKVALAAAAAALDPWQPVARRWSSCVLQVPRSKAANVYQASRAATYIGLSPAPPLTEGATLYLDAACPEGAGQGSGERAFAELMRRTAPPWGSLLTGPVPSGAGLQRAFMLARLAQRYRLVVSSCETAEELESIGITATRTPAMDLAGPDTLVVPEPFIRLPQLV